MDIQALHKALLNPEAYPEKTGGIIFRETHVSRLYFTDRHVYKIKKPVDFGFLNFTSLDRRRFYCNEEVRLNRRFCPDTYLGVVQIRRSGNRIAIDREGEIIDYAVLMRRLPQDRMLDFLLDEGVSFSEGEMERLARRIAGLHQESEICLEVGERSDFENVQANWRENFSQIEPFVGTTLSQAALEICSRYVAGVLDRRRALLVRRQKEGFVRDGHGDLHTEHICLTDPIRIYDCIEFNRRFRVADVVADLAFLLMDLDFRHRRDLGAEILSGYRRAMGSDPEMDILLPFYKVYRAFVRGKVNSFLAEDPEADEAIRREAARKARRYFNLALGYLCPSGLILTCGLMGTGKTTVGRALAEAVGAAFLRSDSLRKELAGMRENEQRGDSFGEGIYSPEFSRQTYHLLLDRSIATLSAGRTAVVDASFIRRADRELFRAAAERTGVPFLILHMECDERTALARLDRRQSLGLDASEGRRELFARQAAAFESITEANDVFPVDTTGDVDYNVHLILCKFLERAGLCP